MVGLAHTPGSLERQRAAQAAKDTPFYQEDGLKTGPVFLVFREENCRSRAKSNGKPR
jgi:hypothetical protein